MVGSNQSVEDRDQVDPSERKRGLAGDVQRCRVGSVLEEVNLRPAKGQVATSAICRDQAVGSDEVPAKSSFDVVDKRNDDVGTECERALCPRREDKPNARLASSPQDGVEPAKDLWVRQPPGQVAKHVAAIDRHGSETNEIIIKADDRLGLQDRPQYLQQTLFQPVPLNLLPSHLVDRDLDGPAIIG